MSREEDMVVILDDDAPPPAVKVAQGDDPDDKLPEGAVRIDRRTVEYRFIDPVTIRLRVNGQDREERVDTIRLTRFRGRDMMDIESASPDRRTMLALSRSSNLSEAKVRAICAGLDQDDMDAMADIISGFKGSGRRTGP
jgi:hypothetical protein